MQTTSSSFESRNGFFRSPRQRFHFVRALVVFAYVALAAKLVILQAFQRTDLQEKAEKQLPDRSDSVDVRFRIYDRAMRPLAETVPSYSCYADPTMIKDKPAAARLLASTLGLDADTVLSQLKDARGAFVWIRRDVGPTEMAAIKAAKSPGIGFRTESRRHYPEGLLAPHLLGLVSRESRGLSGLEQSLDGTLRASGTAGALPRGNVRLTIDSEIQRVAEKELAWGARKINAKRGMALVQDPRTGEMLALAAWPPASVDPEHPDAAENLKIPAVADVFEPGSTFKIVTVAAILEEKLATLTERFDGHKGKFKAGPVTIHDHEPQHNMTLEDILVYSSNIGTSLLGDRLGAERLYRYARKFGFGVAAGSALPGEIKGTLRPPSAWSGISKYTVSFGQEIGVTAIQLIGAFSAVANGGTLMEPRIITSVLDPEGKALWSAEPAPVRRVMSKGNADTLREMLVHVVQRGTGQEARIVWDPNIRVGGKTGTAQKYDLVNRRYDKDLTLISFCGFFPADDPRYTILILLDEPEGRRWGGLDAAPVFRRIAEHLTVRPSEPAS